MIQDIRQAIEQKNIIIWGVGVLQTDLMGLYSFPHFLYYVDDFVREKNLISVSAEEIISSDKLAKEPLENVLFVLCGDDWDDAVHKLKEMGYSRNDYILGEELLVDYKLYDSIHAREISLWGVGNTYSYYESEIREYLPHICNFLDSAPDGQTFEGLPKLSLTDKMEVSPDSFIVVTSIYYKEIYQNLTKAGLCPGRDFIHIYTMISLGNLSTRIHAEYQFTDRRKKSKELLVILAGYKELVWDSVFARVKAYVPKHMDVCIVSSGLENDTLKAMCQENGWSYMSTIRNHVSLVLNLAIALHPEAEYIYKMDEDMFLTENVMQTMMNTYREAQKNYEVGFVTPLIPINGYGYVRLLEIFGAVDRWEERFGELKYTDCYCHHRTVHDDPQAALFLWGEDNPAMDNIDRMNGELQKKKMAYSICPIRYSIGFILFHRDNWIHMGMLPVPESSNMGSDEIYLCKYCLMQARVMVVAENTVVGHFNYGGPQARVMEAYYREHNEKFRLPKEDETKR